MQPGASGMDRKVTGAGAGGIAALGPIESAAPTGTAAATVAVLKGSSEGTCEPCVSRVTTAERGNESMELWQHDTYLLHYGSLVRKIGSIINL